MSDQTTADLIAARDILEQHDLGDVCDESTHDALTIVLDALEAADHRAAQAEAELKDAYRTDIPSLKDQRDAAIKRGAELAAVVEKVLSHDPLHGADSGLHCGGMAPCIRDILATAPADALREMKAEAWDEGADAMAEHIDNGAWWEIQNPYRAREEQS